MNGPAGADQGGLWSEHDCNVNVPVSRLTRGAPLAPSADQPEALPPATMLGLIFLAALLVACGVVRATVYVLTGY